MSALHSLADYAFIYRQRYGKYRRDFQRIFGCNLKAYWDNLTGFDVVAFDDKVIKSGDGCMQDAVQERYGDEGVNLILKLLG